MNSPPNQPPNISRSAAPRPIYRILESVPEPVEMLADDLRPAQEVAPLDHQEMIFESPITASSESPVVALEKVHRHFGVDSVVRALNGVSLTIERGQSLAIVGPSGSGKSTLMNVIGLLDRPTSGTYLLDGNEVGALGERERARIRATRIGFVFQAFHLLAHRTAAENVMLRDAYRRSPRVGRRERAVEMLERVGLGHRVDTLPSKLSGGERQRVAIARALLGNPSLLLCDEPTGNLDSENTASVLDLFDELVSHGITLIVVTHEQDVASRMHSQAHMIDGRIRVDQGFQRNHEGLGPQQEG